MLLSKKEKKIVVIGFLVLIAIFTFVDLPFTKLVFDRESLFGQFFWVFGELPGTLLGTAAFAVLTVSYTKNNTLFKWLNLVFFGVMTLLLGTMVGFQVLHYLELEVMPYAFIGDLVAILFIFLANKLSLEKKKEVRVYAAITAWLVFIGIFGPNMIKILWARPRYRIFNGDDSLYQPWYVWNGMTSNDDFKSFPSGHSALSSTVIAATFLPYFFKSLKGKERQILLCVAVWIALVMVSRVVMGDHFMTDTLFGTGLTLLAFAGLKKIFLKNRE